MGAELFGKSPKGEDVHRVTISGGGLTANIMTWGAVIQDLRLEGHDAPLMLGFETYTDYPVYSSYFGATPGRCSNRIAGGRFTLNGETIQLECNEKGINHLHGGSDGIAKQVWTIAELASDRVVLEITDKAGRAGYPGNARVKATFWLKADGCLSIVYETEADAPTPVNICNHSYFNLDGGGDILDHELMIAADSYLPTDEAQIPTGEMPDVTGGPFDFRKLRPVRLLEDGEQVLYDHNFCLSNERVAKRKVAELRSPSSGIAMDVLTTEPGVQFYAAFKLSVPVSGIGGRNYGPYAALCLETQVWPDAVNHAHFPNAILNPGDVLRQETDYVFRRFK
jgi:aldose 1-epimerase